jgi:glycosyltransferase involved in cell wall biosynthesis
VRIALCITALETGGAERCLAELAARLDRARFDPVVYCLARRPAADRPSVMPRLEEAGVPIHFLGARGLGAFPGVVRDLARLWRAERPDMALSFLFHANIAGRLAARRAGVPRMACGIRVAERRHRWYLWSDRVTSRLVDRYVCVSQSVAEFSIREGGLPADRVMVIPNGVDLACFPSREPADLTVLGLPPGRRAIVCISRLEEQKRPDWLIELCPGWMKTWPHHDLLLVGDGPLRASLAQQAARLGIADRVHITGWRPDVPAILAASDLLVLPSAWEGMPNVVAEAMATGLPVLATPVEGVCELLGDGTAAQTSSADDPARFALRIAGICANLQLAKELGAENRLRIGQHFDIRAMVAAYENLFIDLLGA